MKKKKENDLTTGVVVIESSLRYKCDDRWWDPNLTFSFGRSCFRSFGTYCEERGSPLTLATCPKERYRGAFAHPFKWFRVGRFVLSLQTFCCRFQHHNFWRVGKGRWWLSIFFYHFISHCFFQHVDYTQYTQGSTEVPYVLIGWL